MRHTLSVRGPRPASSHPRGAAPHFLPAASRTRAAARAGRTPGTGPTNTPRSPLTRPRPPTPYLRRGGEKRRHTTCARRSASLRARNRRRRRDTTPRPAGGVGGAQPTLLTASTPPTERGTSTASRLGPGARHIQTGPERQRTGEERRGQERPHRSASGIWKGDLERSRGTGKGPTETHSRDRRGTRRTRRDGIPPRRRGRDRPRATSPHTGALASEGRLPRQGTTAPPTPRGRGRGSAVEPEDAAPLPPRHRQRAGWRSEGPAGRARRAGPFAMNVRPSSGAA